MVEAFARVTYQSVYLIDYYRQEILYVSDNPLFLCGHTAKEVKELGRILLGACTRGGTKNAC